MAVTDLPTPTYPEYPGLLAAAEASVRADGGFVDPAKFRRFQDLARSEDWRTSIKGHSGRTTVTELHLLLIADESGIEPPLPSWLAAQRAEQQARRQANEKAATERLRIREAQWNALVQALPVPVLVAYNYSGPNHYETWTQGANHILVAKDLHVGRLHRTTNDALCTTASSRRHQDFGPPDAPPDRFPTCKACIRIACRLTGLEAPSLLQTVR